MRTRLTEKDLSRIVKRVINEDTPRKKRRYDADSKEFVLGLGHLAISEMPHFNFRATGSKAEANDNMMEFALGTMKKLGIPNFFLQLNYRHNDSEIWTNDKSLAVRYLKLMDKNPSSYTFWDENDEEIK